MISQEEIEGFLWPNDGEILNERPIQNDVLTLKEASTSGNEKIIRPEDVLYAQVGMQVATPPPSNNDIIIVNANKRFNNKIISYSYGWEPKWNFSPCDHHFGYIDLSDLMVKDIDFYSMMILFYSEKGYDLVTNWPNNNGKREGIIYKGWTHNKCNIFVFDVLEMAGLYPPLYCPDTSREYRYYTPEILDYLCHLKYLKKINMYSIVPGDIFRTGDKSHMAIVYNVYGDKVLVIQYSAKEQIGFGSYNKSGNDFYRVIGDKMYWGNPFNRYNPPLPKPW